MHLLRSTGYALLFVPLPLEPACAPKSIIAFEPFFSSPRTHARSASIDQGDPKCR
jgi:hypothetical protein